VNSNGATATFKASCRRIVVNGLYHTGLLRGVERFANSHELYSVQGAQMPRLRKFRGSKFGILCYHRVGTRGIPLFSRLEPRIFDAQMNYLRKHYRLVSLKQLCSELQDGFSVEPTLAITFDDGYRDLYTHAFPVLQKYEIPATIYLIGQSVETGKAPWYDRIFVALESLPGPELKLEMQVPRCFALSSPAARAVVAWEIVCFLRSIPDSARQKWCAEFESSIQVPHEKLHGSMLTWEQVRTMHRGGISFGAHTMSHPVVSQLDASDFDEELARSKSFLESGLQAPIDDFAYPFGKPADCGLEAERFLQRCGYRSAVTTTSGFNAAASNIYRLRRLQIGDDSSLPLFAFRVAQMFLESTEPCAPTYSDVQPEPMKLGVDRSSL